MSPASDVEACRGRRTATQDRTTVAFEDFWAGGGRASPFHACPEVAHDAVSRRELEQLDLSGVEMICLVHLEVTGSPSHLRYLLQRLRERLPNGKLLVGLWPSEEAPLKDEASRRELGADYCVASLRQAVETCLQIARG